MIYLLYLFCFLIISCDLPSEANQDCNGDSGGIATLDNCGICSGGDTNVDPCEKDCNDVWGGLSMIDECGVCDGNSLTCADCLSVPNGTAEIDECGVCNGLGLCLCSDGTESCNCCCPTGEVLDCYGECINPTLTQPAILDDCDICEGDSFFGTNPGDVCGCTIDDIIDGCGECDGNGFVDCMCTNVANTEFTYIDSNTSFQCNGSGSAPYQIGDQLSCETLQTEFDICYPEDCGSVKLADFEGKNILIIYEFDW